MNYLRIVAGELREDLGWAESKVKRGPGGKFASKGGGGKALTGLGSRQPTGKRSGNGDEIVSELDNILRDVKAKKRRNTRRQSGAGAGKKALALAGLAAAGAGAFALNQGIGNAAKRMGVGSQGSRRADFDEGKHPRDKAGRSAITPRGQYELRRRLGLTYDSALEYTGNPQNVMTRELRKDFARAWSE